jgi:hypothetical protein
MWIICLIFVIFNIIAAPGYLSALKIETDTSIYTLSTITSLLPILLVVLYPYQIIYIILGQLAYICIGVYLTSRT